MGFLLLIPFFFIRFWLLSHLSKNALQRAAYFAPLLDKKQAAYWIYQIANIGILLCIAFSKIKFAPISLLCAGIVIYAVGTVILAAAIVDFAAPAENGINKTGLYKRSRNPMYVAYFFFFLGCALLTQSLPLFVFVLVFQLSAHWIILSEERWCIKRFGEEYLRYMERVRRYF